MKNEETKREIIHQLIGLAVYKMEVKKGLNMADLLDHAIEEAGAGDLEQRLLEVARYCYFAGAGAAIDNMMNDADEMNLEGERLLDAIRADAREETEPLQTMLFRWWEG